MTLATTQPAPAAQPIMPPACFRCLGTRIDPDGTVCTRCCGAGIDPDPLAVLVTADRPGPDQAVV